MKQPPAYLSRYLWSFGLTFALLFGGAWYWVATHPMSFLDLEYPMWKAKADMLDRCEIGSTPVLGDSKAVASMGANDLGPGFVNFAVGGGSMFDLLSISRRIVACEAPPKAVFMSLTIGRFLDFQYFWDRSVKYDVLGLSVHDFQDFRQRARHYGDDAVFGAPGPFDIDARLKIFLYTLKFPAFYAGSLIESRLAGRKQANSMIYAETLREKGWHFFGTANGNDYIEGYVDFKHFAPSALQRALFDEMLALYRDRHIPVYYYSPPYKDRDLTLLPAAVRSDYESYLADYQSRFPNFHTIGDTFVGLPIEDFGDPNHVNPKGKEAWSRHFLEMLAENHIER